MKTSTRQYAKRQTSWLRNKLLPILYAANERGDSDRHEVRIATFTYLLDATGLLKPIRHSYSHLSLYPRARRKLEFQGQGTGCGYHQRYALRLKPVNSINVVQTKLSWITDLCLTLCLFPRLLKKSSTSNARTQSMSRILLTRCLKAQVKSQSKCSIERAQKDYLSHLYCRPSTALHGGRREGVAVASKVSHSQTKSPQTTDCDRD